MFTVDIGMRWYIAVLIAALVFFAVESAFVIGLPQGDSQVAGVNVAGDLIALCAVVSLWGLYRRIPVEFSTERRCWALLAFGVSMHLLGDVVWSFTEIVLGNLIPIGGIVDALYLGGYFLIAAGLLLFVTRVFFIERRLLSVGLAILSAISLFVCLGLVAWGIGEGVSFVALIQNFYVAADVVLISLMLMIMIPLLGSQEHAAVFWMVFGGSFVLLFAYDLGFTLLTAKGSYFTGHPIDMFYGAAYLGFVLAVAWKMNFFEGVASRD